MLGSHKAFGLLFALAIANTLNPYHYQVYTFMIFTNVLDKDLICLNTMGSMGSNVNKGVFAKMSRECRVDYDRPCAKLHGAPPPRPPPPPPLSPSP